MPITDIIISTIKWLFQFTALEHLGDSTPFRLVKLSRSFSSARCAYLSFASLLKALLVAEIPSSPGEKLRVHERIVTARRWPCHFDWGRVGVGSSVLLGVALGPLQGSPGLACHVPMGPLGRVLSRSVAVTW